MFSRLCISQGFYCTVGRGPAESRFSFVLSLGTCQVSLNIVIWLCQNSFDLFQHHIVAFTSIKNGRLVTHIFPAFWPTKVPLHILVAFSHFLRAFCTPFHDWFCTFSPSLPAFRHLWCTHLRDMHTPSMRTSCPISCEIHLNESYCTCFRYYFGLNAYLNRLHPI